MGMCYTRKEHVHVTQARVQPRGGSGALGVFKPNGKTDPGLKPPSVIKQTEEEPAGTFRNIPKLMHPGQGK
jgi:hypothetical protein